MGQVFFGIRKSRDRSLPDQKFLLDACLRPGRKVDLVLGSLSDASQADIRTTILCGLEKKKLLLAQTRPRLDEALLGREVFVTFLAGANDGGRVRVGYRAVLEKGGRRRGSGEELVVVSAPKKLGRLTLRLNRRLAPPAEAGLGLLLLPGREALSLADISQSGVRFFHPGHLAWEPGDDLELLLVVSGRELGLVARVVRGERNLLSGGTSAGVTAARFKPGQDEALRRLGSILGGMFKAKDKAPAIAMLAD